MVEADLYRLLEGVLPGDHSRQSSALSVLQAHLAQGWRPGRVLVVAAEGLRTIGPMRQLLPTARWSVCRVAVPQPRASAPTQMLTSDACELQCPDGWFDLVVLLHALERVRSPESLLRESRRVLASEGRLIGQVSQLEPLLDGAFRNLTVFGLKTVAEDAGLALTELRPGIDAFTLMRRAIDGRSDQTSRFFVEESPLNAEIAALEQGQQASVTNHRKLHLAGQFVFCASPAPGERSCGLRDRASVQPIVDPAFTGSQAYWCERYAAGRNSGAGSYGKFAAFKAEVLNQVFDELEVRRVVDLGCGDGHQVGLLTLTDYIGVDVSPVAIERCRALYAGRSELRFMLEHELTDETADAALSLDVVYHLVEEPLFHRHMSRLFSIATKLVVVYASNFEEPDTGAAHVRHRRFTDWVAENARAWTLWRLVPNRYPWRGDHRNGSFADFYLFRPRGAAPQPQEQHG